MVFHIGAKPKVPAGARERSKYAAYMRSGRWIIYLADFDHAAVGQAALEALYAGMRASSSR
ncbi:MAG: hypothetical protein R3E48_00300 [Burkholderiaceae bacterium]